MSPNIFVIVSFAASAWVLLGSHSSAQMQPAPPPQTILEQVLACAQIEDGQGRLSCFDAAVAQLTPSAVPEGSIIGSFAGEGDWTSDVIQIDGSWQLAWQSAAEVLTIELRDADNRFVKLAGSEFGGGEDASETLPAGIYRINVSAYGGEWRIQIVGN